MEIFAQIVIPVITFFTGLLSKIVYDSFLSFQKENGKEKYRRFVRNCIYPEGNLLNTLNQ